MAGLDVAPPAEWMVTASRTARRSAVPALQWLLGAWSAGVAVFLYVPLLVLVWISFNRGPFLMRWEGFGTNAYLTALSSSTMRGVLGTSLAVGALSAILAVALGSAAGLVWARRPGRWTRPFAFTLVLVLVAPEIVLAIAELIWFVRIGIDAGLVRLVISHSVFSTAVVALIVRSRMSNAGLALEEAAADLGAPPGRVFRDVTLPEMLPAMLAGGLLAFTFSMDDVVISSFVATAGSTTLPVFVFSSLRAGLRTEVAALAVMALVATLTALVATAVVLRRSGALGTILGHSGR